MLKRLRPCLQRLRPCHSHFPCALLHARLHVCLKRGKRAGACTHVSSHACILQQLPCKSLARSLSLSLSECVCIYIWELVVVCGSAPLSCTHARAHAQTSETKREIVSHMSTDALAQTHTSTHTESGRTLVTREARAVASEATPPFTT